MGFEFGAAINGGAEWVCRSTLGNRVARNPVVTALLITALCLVIIFATFREEFRDAGWRKILRVGLYIGFFVTLLLFVHYYALRRCIEDEHAQKGVRSVVDSVHLNYSGAGSAVGTHKVNPGEIDFGGGALPPPDLPGHSAPLPPSSGPGGHYGAGHYGAGHYGAGRPDNVSGGFAAGPAVTDAVFPSELGASVSY